MLSTTSLRVGRSGFLLGQTQAQPVPAPIKKLSLPLNEMRGRVREEVLNFTLGPYFCSIE